MVSKRIFIVGTLPLWRIHLPWQMELLQEHINREDETFVELCFGDKLACDANHELNPVICRSCILQHESSLKLLKGKFSLLPKFSLTANEAALVENTPPPPEEWDEFWQLQFDNFDIGVAALSSIVTTRGTAYPDLRKLKSYTPKLLKAALARYLWAKRLLKNYKPDIVYIFNGRLTHTRAWLRACENEKIEYVTYDHAYNHNSIRLYRNSTPHSISFFEAAAKQHWEFNIDDKSRIDRAQEFYLNRRTRKDMFTGSFLKSQSHGELPNLIDKSKRWLGFFTSSEDEFRAVGDEWNSKIYDSQIEALKRIVNSPEFQASSLNLAVRLHPRMAELGVEQWEHYTQLESPRLHVIKPSDSCDSYALMDISEKVITFSSTMGVEASFWGKPAILLGATFYMNLDACYTPQNHDEVMNYILAENLKPKPREGSLIYGYYETTHGQKLTHTEVASNGVMKVNNQILPIIQTPNQHDKKPENRLIRRLRQTRLGIFLQNTVIIFRKQSLKITELWIRLKMRSPTPNSGRKTRATAP
jgi:hypothetical protein